MAYAYQIMGKEFIRKQVAPWLIVAVIVIATVELLRSHSWHPPAGVYVSILAFVSVFATWYRGEKAGWIEKGIWSFFMLALVVLELQSIRMDHREAQKQFEATMNQALGGHGFPYFKPVLPALGTATGPVYPLRVFYSTKENLPLVDVKVDISLLRRKGERPDKYIISGPLVAEGSEQERIFHSRHYDLGNVFPGTFETPIELPAGDHYLLRISTRRELFYEEIRFDPDKNEPLGWKISTCEYRMSDKQAVRTDGNCSNPVQ